MFYNTQYSFKVGTYSIEYNNIQFLRRNVIELFYILCTSMRYKSWQMLHMK